MDKPSSSKLFTSIKEIKEENLNEDTDEGQEEMYSTERLHWKILEIEGELLELIKKKGKTNHKCLINRMAPLKNRPPFQYHSGHIDQLQIKQYPWPHQHHIQNKDQVLYQEE
ncbi:hypothetical protein O181_013983 [Austropuccinia psidii MF-1]|uniref:Uncharacterized protein n=1 Tax=Austropuccinia psidii MF-1 TaxID=1389203 RepID=A0A9Q3C0C9_9BASI|nr:hypothetical protein [Austropuccinia psidii MF-1]